MKIKNIILIIICILFISILVNQINGLQVNDNIVIFVLDSEVNQDILERKPIINGNNISHGSIVSRTINKQVPNAKIIPIAVDRDEVISRELYIAGLKKVIDYSIDNPGKKVLVNISLSFSNYDESHHSLIKKLRELGVLVIASAGNEGKNITVYPAGFDETIAVASATKDGKADYSNYGEMIDIAAPGSLSNTFRMYYAGGLKYNHINTTGTSLAAPRVTGLTANVLLMNNKLSNFQAFSYIENRTDKIDDEHYQKNMLGAGVINKNRVLSDLDPLYHLKQPLFLVALLFIFMTFYLWSSYSFFSILLSLLFILIGIPMFLFIEELVYSFKIGNIPLFHISFVIICLAFILIPVFIRWKRKYNLKKYLQRTDSFDLAYLFDYIGDDETLCKIVEKYIQESQNMDLLKKLLNTFKTDDIEKIRVSGKFLRIYKAKQVVPELLNIIEDDSKDADVSSQVVILDIIEDIAVDDLYLKEKINNIVKDMLFSEDNDMWLRYQALRTLFAKSKKNIALKALLLKLKNDRDEVIRLEAEGLLKEF